MSSCVFHLVFCNFLSLQGVSPCRPVTRPQGGLGALSSPSRMMSLEPRVVEEALADDARTATPPQGRFRAGRLHRLWWPRGWKLPRTLLMLEALPLGRWGNDLPNDHRRRPHQCSPWWGGGPGQGPASN
jgi:hypothetical protein